MSEALSSAGPTDARPPFRFSLRTRTEVADTDLAGHVYYARYMQLCDRAVVAYRRRLGLSPLGPAGHLLVVKAFECDFRASLQFDEATEIFLRTSRIGRTSHMMRYRVEGDGGRHVADIGQTFVGLERYGGRPSAMPQDMRAAIRQFDQAPESR